MKAAIKALALVLSACAPDLEGTEQGRCGRAVPCLPGFECYRGFCLAAEEPPSDTVFETDAGGAGGREVVRDSQDALAADAQVAHVSETETPTGPMAVPTGSLTDAGGAEPMRDASASVAPTIPAVVDATAAAPTPPPTVNAPSSSGTPPSPPATTSPPPGTPAPIAPQDAGGANAGGPRDGGTPSGTCKVESCCSQSKGPSGSEGKGKDNQCPCDPTILCATSSMQGKKN
jgi:hypothetical protein